MIDARDGPQRGNWQYALVKDVPCSASLSRFGVLHCGCPYPLSAVLRSSAITNRTFGRLGIPAAVTPETGASHTTAMHKIIVFLISKILP
jgi:hypothetical protein